MGATWPAAPAEPQLPLGQTDSGTGRGQPWDRRALVSPPVLTLGPQRHGPNVPMCLEETGRQCSHRASPGPGEFFGNDSAFPAHGPALLWQAGWAWSGPVPAPSWASLVEP